MFHKGQKVVCIDGEFDDPEFWEIYPKAGGIYTIRDFFEDFLYLEEIINPDFDYKEGGSGECCFDPANFRPLTSKPTSIEVFQKMLTPNQVDA